MRWTITYSLMTICLMGTLAAVLCGSPEFFAKFGTSSSYASVVRSRGPAAQQQPTLVIAQPVAPVSVPATTIVEVEATPSGQIRAGATREQVLATLGQPTKLDNNRWLYGSQMIMFKNDVVTGSVQADLEQAARNLESKIEKSTTKSPNRTPMKNVAKRQMAKRSAPKARGYRPSNAATLWEPMFRRFYSDSPLPRSQNHWGRYNSRPGYRDQRYTDTRSVYRRR